MRGQLDDLTHERAERARAAQAGDEKRELRRRKKALREGKRRVISDCHLRKSRY
jgi:hypothetical protein